MLIGRHSALTAGFALLVGLATGSASAQDAGEQVALWDMHLAGSADGLLLSDDTCHTGPYRLYRQTCVGNELNITLDRESRTETLLDQVAVFVHRHKDLNLARDIQPGTRVRFKAKVSDVIYDQEAEVKVTLRMRF